MRQQHFLGFSFACLAIALTACSSPSQPPAESAPATVVETPVAVIGDETSLRQAAAAALSEQRIHTPAGNNAIEHYLALRRLRSDDHTLDTALLELLPYALIASEQAVSRGDFPEALRLAGLIEQVDPQAPALPRLRESVVVAEQDAAQRIIADAETAKRLEQETALAAEAEAARVRQALAVAAANTPPPALPPRTEPAPAAVAAPPPPQPQPAAPIATTPARAPTPKLLSAPQPRYPLVALRRKIEGSVAVEFTIQPDGSVTAPRVLSADPPGLFEEAALLAATRWRFERTPTAVTAAREVRFRLDTAQQ